MKDELFNQRMDFVQSILALNDLKVNSIKPVKYDPETIFSERLGPSTHMRPNPYSVISSQANKAVIHPGTSPIPVGCNSVIMRLYNKDPKTGINNANRAENEVACMSLARQALAGSAYSCIIPDIYTWASISQGQGFIMMQHMPGEVTNKALNKMDIDDKSAVFRQMADILALIQKFELPKTIEAFGGLTFNDKAHATSAQMTLRVGGPSTSCRDFIRSMLAGKLEEADNNSVIEGWNENKLRPSLDKYLEVGLPHILDHLKNERRVLLHSYFTTNKLLFDPDKFLGFSFSGIYGAQLPGPNSEAFDHLIREAILNRFPESLPTFESEELKRQWKVAKAWNAKLARSGAATPQTIPHFDRIADIYWLEDNLSPFDLENKHLRQQNTQDELRARREEIVQILGEILDDEGFGSSDKTQGSR
ncbi:hypothetical protein BJ878DRAFT_537243 [Calycina marina]|uniref:Aminoglycoside phosphotransferase domain-containing protein n=1 Tax=Calycina marina TaxID=1763456 RepID=A0A9P7YUY0_9HELO|nr:hypothetical protein BJ878DRAFT_537243 [Calycina marina]